MIAADAPPVYATHGISTAVLVYHWRGGHATVPRKLRHLRIRTLQAAKPITWPQAPCNLENRMNVAIVEDLFFECQCYRLQNGYQCDWYLVAGVEAASSRKLKRPARRHARVLIHAALPSVVA